MSTRDDTNAIANFISEKRGFCVQFASTYAVMARSLGIPSRVAVGFTPGDLRDGVFHVQSHNAHAWPEIWLAGLGWTHLFDPTPPAGSSGVTAGGSLLPGDETIVPPATPGVVTTKASEGHDEFITFDDVANEIGRETTERLRDLTIEIYTRGAERAAQAGIIVADTKFEFGHDDAGVLTLADEVLTSDSSRFWPADEWEPGHAQHAFDKQFVRDWSRSTGWDMTPPGPAMPDDVVEATRARYTEVYERITGNTWR